VVRDGNLITAGGVTSGIDFGLEVVADIAGEAVARSIQLSLEYDPNPPFASGHPDRATAATLAEVGPRYAERRADFRKGSSEW
jgi:cyclohexyl-isocyanide hydratase